MIVGVGVGATVGVGANVGSGVLVGKMVGAVVLVGTVVCNISDGEDVNVNVGVVFGAAVMPGEGFVVTPSDRSETVSGILHRCHKSMSVKHKTMPATKNILPFAMGFSVTKAALESPNS